MSELVEEARLILADISKHRETVRWFRLRLLGLNAPVTEDLCRALFDFDCFLVWVNRGEFDIARQHHNRLVGD